MRTIDPAPSRGCPTRSDSMLFLSLGRTHRMAAVADLVLTGTSLSFAGTFPAASASANLGEADDRDGVGADHLTVVELAQPGGHVLPPPDLRVVVLDLPGRQLEQLLHL